MRALRALASLSIALFLCPAAADAVVRTINVTGNDLAYDATRNKLYLSVPSSAGANGNSLRVLDPVTATAGPSVFVGSEPGAVAVSDNGQYAYVGLNGAAAVRRVDLSSFTAGLQFPLGSDSFLGLYYPEDIEVVPGDANAVAVSRRNSGYSPRHEGVAIYDNGVRRPTETPGHTGSNVIEFGASPDTLYGYNNETTDFGFRTMNVTAAGVQTTSSAAGLISGFGVDFDYGGGKVVSTTGRVIDPVSRTLLGTLGGSGPVAVERDGNRAYFVSGNSILIYNLNTFLSAGTITVPGMSGGSEILRWGADGLAVRTNSAVYLINDPAAIPEPTAAAAAGLAGVIALSRALRHHRTRRPSR